MPRSLRASLLFLVLGAAACDRADTVELGGVCSQQAECKEPADTCMTLLGADSLCTMACSADAPCPESYACARMDVQVQGADGGGKAGAQGYCLARARLGPHVATIAPRKKGGQGGKKGRKRGKKGRKAENENENAGEGGSS